MRPNKARRIWRIGLGFCVAATTLNAVCLLSDPRNPMFTLQTVICVASTTVTLCYPPRES